MSASESVTGWLTDFRNGESNAAEKLWERYFGQLLQLARAQLGLSPRRMADEEDVVVAAFASFCRGVRANRFSKLHDREDLWTILVMVTERKAIDQMRHDLAAKRGGGLVRGESVFDEFESDEATPNSIDRIIDARPTPEFAAELADQLDRLLHSLANDDLQRIAVEKLEGHTNKEIAQHSGMSLRSVERQLRLIRRIWGREDRDDRLKSK